MLRFLPTGLNRGAIAKSLALALCSLLCFLCLSLPLLAQTPDSNSPPKAPILVDGDPIFEVSRSGDFSAQQRAREANEVLANLVENIIPDQSLNVTIDERQQVPVLLINGRYLISVTQADTPPGRSAINQADVWRSTLQQALEKAKYQRTPEYIRYALLLSGGALILALLASWLVGNLWKRWFPVLLEQFNVEINSEAETNRRPPTEIISHILLSLIRGILIFFAGFYIASLFPQTRNLSREIRDSLVETVQVSLTSGIFPLGDNAYSVLDILILIGLLAGVLSASRLLRRILRSRILILTGLNRSAQENISLIANYTFIFIATIVILQIWGLNLNSLTVFASVLGVGISLGLQGITKEFVSGIVLLFERPIQVGDFVDVGGLVGTVERIGVRSTEIRTLDRISIILPNSRFLESEVINWSHDNPISRLRIPLGVAYGSDIKRVRNALLDAAQAHPDILSIPSPVVFFTGFGDSALDFTLLVWIAHPPKQFQIKSDLYFLIEERFRREDIEIPFPQRDLHVRSGQLPITVSPELAESLQLLSQNLTHRRES
ncbi:mechanosensitive ion channel family protein [Spirulina subsalsa]|uniref:mechanosensitive ion channel family protein n=1 Tax=Spirulina subsalsa TaxID=54311 RepID=UPI002237F0D1|nr:mechanosensitive ion channel domain-containing protein [Spirulina subsalsa]